MSISRVATLFALSSWSLTPALAQESLAYVDAPVVVLTDQERFETLAREATGQRQGNPFPLVFEGELLPQ